MRRGIVTTESRAASRSILVGGHELQELPGRFGRSARAGRGRRWRRPRKKGYDALRAEHIADYQKLFRRVTIDLGHSAAEKLPTDERIRNFASGSDPSLVALVFQFGRYLLIGIEPAGRTAGEFAGPVERFEHARRGTASTPTTSTPR